MKVKYKKMYEDAMPPKRLHPTDAGADLYAHSVRVNEFGALEIGTGLAFDIPAGYVGLLFARSSLRSKDLTVANSVGVIDSGYIGEVKINLKPASRFTKEKRILYPQLGNNYEVGDRCAQIVIIPIPSIEFDEVQELEGGERGVNGHGSTGNN